MNEDDVNQQEEPSSRHLLVALEDLLKRSHNSSTVISKIKYQSKSVDDLLIHRRHQREKEQDISNTTRTEFDLSGIGYDEENDDYDLQIQRSQSAPVSPTKIYDKELAAFIQSDQLYQETIGDNFVYNIDLSDSDENSHQPNSRLAIFFEDDYSSDEIDYEPSVNLMHSSLINNCLTITEENEEELEQLRRDDDEQEQQQKQNLLFKLNEDSIPTITLNDDNQTDIFENDNQTNEDMNNLSLMNTDTFEDNIERLSTIFESPSLQLDIEDNINNDKLIVYDIATVDTLTKSSSIPAESSVSPPINQTRISSCYTDAFFESCPNFTNTLSASHLCGTTTMITSKLFNPPSLSTCSLTTPVINTEIIPLSLPQKQQSSQHIKKMKVIQSSSSSLSDFISPITLPSLQKTTHYEDVPTHLTEATNKRKSPSTRHILTNGLLLSHCSSNPIPRRTQELPNSIHDNHYLKKQNSEEKLSSNSSSSSDLILSSDERLLSRSDVILQEEQNIHQQRKASSLKTISMISPRLSSKILYPIDFEINNINKSWYQKQVPTSDSGIIIDTQSTSKSNIEEDDTTNINQLKKYQTNYRKLLTELTTIKRNLVDVESRLNEAMRELEIEQALIEGEHELVFKQILDSSEIDQQKIKHLYKNLQLLVERIMTEKNFVRNQIDYTQQTLFKLEYELHELEGQYQSSDEKIIKKKEMIAVNRKKYEDLEFQLMELETRCESELEQAEEYFQTEQKLVTQNAKIRHNTLRELDHQQYLVLHQITLEKDKLERERQKLKLLFKQKKIEATQLEQKLHNRDLWSNANHINRAIYQSTPINLYNMNGVSPPKMEKKDDQQKMKILRGLSDDDYQVKLREKSRAQERPLTRYLPIRSSNFNLRAHIEGAGHSLDSSHISVTSTSCRGYLHKMGGIKFKTWNRRWFVFDRQCRSLYYYQDKTETKLRGCINFQSILEVYIDHLQSTSLRSPEPRAATFIVKTIQRPFYLVAPTIELMRIWIDVIITGAEGNTFAGV